MNETHKSIQYPVAIDAVMGELGQERDYGKHIEQLMKQVLLTAPGERINRPDLGCGLRQMIFAPLADVTESMTKITVFEALDRWLGDLISVDDVKVNVTNETLEVHIIYYFRARQERRYLNLEVSL